MLDDHGLVKMDSLHDNKTMDVEEDRLSSLPDDLIHKVLSYIGVKDAIKTSCLSSRWRYIWTSMPYLNFSKTELLMSRDPSKFVTDVLSHRDNLIGLFSINLTCGPLDCCWFTWVFVKRILDYAFCYNVQQLTLQFFDTDFMKFPISLLKSKSLKHLTLSGYCCRQLIMPPSTWELLALTTLHLHYITFCNESTDKCIGLFSKCVNLKNLTLNECTMWGLEGFRICHPRLSNLSIIDDRGRLFTGDYPLQFATNSLHSLEELDLCIMFPSRADASKLFGLLQHLHGVKFLTINLELIEFLSSYMDELTSRPPSPFGNLKCLKSYPTYMYNEPQPRPLSTEIKNYFLDGSPTAYFKLISHESYCGNA